MTDHDVAMQMVLWYPSRPESRLLKAGVAQLDRASVYETEGYRFESCHPRSAGLSEECSGCHRCASSGIQAQGRRFTTLFADILHYIGADALRLR